MKKQIKKIFVSFTNDIADDVLKVTKKVIDNINKILHENHDYFSLQVKSWKDVPSNIQSGCTPQDIIDGLMEDSDILLAFFWTRFGTPCGKKGYSSGVEYEIDHMLKLGKRVSVYFLNRPIDQSNLGNEDYVKQYNQLLEYKAKLQTDHGLFKECNFDSLESVLENDFTEIVQEYRSESSKSEPSIENTKFLAQMYYHNYFYTEDIQRKSIYINLAISYDSEEPNYYFLRSLVYHKRGDVFNEINDLTRAIELSSNPWNYLLSRSIIYHNFKNYQKALTDINTVINALGERPRFLLTKTTHLYKLYEFDEAVDILRDLVVELNENAMVHAFFCIALLRAHFKQLKADEIMQLKKSELPHDHDTEIGQEIDNTLRCEDINKYDYIILAKVNIIFRNFHQAKIMLRNAIKIRKNIGEIYFLFSKIAHYENKPDEEEKQLEKAMKLKYVMEKNGDWLL